MSSGHLVQSAEDKESQRVHERAEAAIAARARTTEAYRQNQFDLQGLTQNEINAYLDRQRTKPFACSSCNTEHRNENFIYFKEGCSCLHCVKSNPVRSRICSQCDSFKK